MAFAVLDSELTLVDIRR